MKVLLFLNGIERSQAGIEDGFSTLYKNGEIDELNWFYFEDYAKNNSILLSLNKIIDLSKMFQPNIIIFFHISDFPINRKFINDLKDINSKPIIIYDEGDMYGGWSKPITKSMKEIIKYADFVSIRGLGRWYKTIRKYNNNILYTPHSDSLYRHTTTLDLNVTRKKEIVFIGNKVSSKLGNIRRLSGASQREKTLKYLSNNLNGRLSIYGNGWSNLIGNMNKLEFHKQFEICSMTWFHLSYEHYPEIPYYFSDRLPISLACGQIYICHFHKGYEQIFKGCDFIYFYKTSEEALDVINYLMSLSIDELKVKSENALNYCKSYLSPLVVWRQLLLSVKDK